MGGRNFNKENGEMEWQGREKQQRTKQQVKRRGTKEELNKETKKVQR
jgi:hypothetical protein